MKQVLTSTGLLAVGALSLHAYDPEMTRQQTGRPFSVAATVRGFYDDNVNTSPDKVIIAGVKTNPRESSYGVQISPSVHLNLPLEQTFISLGYVYSLNWYENRDPNDIDQSHEFNAKLRHEFSPRHNVGVDDSFVVTSEPTVVDRFGIVTSPIRLRTRSSVMHNLGTIEDNIGLTRVLGLSFGYVNSWYDYEQDGAGSRSALLDRIEHSLRGDLRYQFTPKIVGLVGYTFGLNDYTANEFLFTSPPTLPDGTVVPNPKSKIRDSYTHKGYVGVDYDLTAKLRASARVGMEYVDYHETGDSEVSPYADASLTYTYLPGDSIEVGIRHERSATDVAGASGVVDAKGRPTLDAETTAIYAQLSHQILYNLTASIIGQYQISTFQYGVNNGSSEELYTVGVNLEYRINRHFSTEVGYNYDNLQSDLGGRSYDRNRVYIGVRATY